MSTNSIAESMIADENPGEQHHGIGDVGPDLTEKSNRSATDSAAAESPELQGIEVTR